MFSIDNQKKIVLTKGDDAILRVHVFNGDKEIYIDGTVKFTVRATPDTQQYLFQKTSTDGYIEIDSSDTSTANCGLYCYDVQYTDENDKVSTIIKSFFEITAEITK